MITLVFILAQMQPATSEWWNSPLAVSLVPAVTFLVALALVPSEQRAIILLSFGELLRRWGRGCLPPGTT